MAKKKFSELRAKMSPEAQARSRESAAALLQAMDLAELRGEREVTQEQLATRLEIAQSGVSRLEKRGDMKVSTLREVVKALGGELQLVAEFPEGDFIRINQFEQTA